MWLCTLVPCGYILWYCVTIYCGTLWIYDVVLWWLYIVVFTLWLLLGFLRICRHFLSFTVEDYSPTTVVDSHFSIKDTRLSTLQRLAEKCSNGSKTCNKIVCCYQIATVSGLTITVIVTFFVYIQLFTACGQSDGKLYHVGFKSPSVSYFTHKLMLIYWCCFRLLVNHTEILSCNQSTAYLNYCSAVGLVVV